MLCFFYIACDVSITLAEQTSTIHKKLQRQMYDHLCGKQEHGGSLTLRERQFWEEYSKIARKQGKDAVIRRENKTQRRKKKNRP